MTETTIEYDFDQYDFDQRNQELAQLVESGVPVAEVANRYGVSTQRVYALLKRMGVAERPGHVRDEGKREWLRQQRDRGRSVRDLASELGISTQRVYTLLRD